MVAVTMTIPAAANRVLQLSIPLIIRRIYTLFLSPAPAKPPAIKRVTPTTAIVILNFNGRKFLEQFLPFVTANCCPGATVVVADNASTDDSIPFVKEHYPAIRIIAMDKNRGFAGGYN